jgi:alpha-glucosidase
MSIPFVDVKSFTPNSGTWTPVGDIQSVARAGNTFTLTLQGGARTLQISALGPRCVRVRFNPTPGASYAQEISPAVVNRNLGTVALTIVEQSATRLAIDTGGMLVDVALQPYRLRVFRGAQLVSADEPSYNLIYIPNALVTANCKTRPDGARYCGFGEKAGAQVLKNLFTMTQFNYDNFSYTKPTVPAGTEPGPLNPSDALYASIPFMLEVNPAPSGPFAGAPYAGGIFFDNGGQSYFNMGANDYSNMDGKYYFGGLFNEMDYYYFLGDGPADVLTAYTTLTGRAPMPPKYVFGYHQGGYGYFDRAKLESIADALRASRIPCDGLHIDVDFQDNYRTFTHSERKFPNAKQMLDNLRARGFKCSTNITPILTDNTVDENNTTVLYVQRDMLRKAGALIYDTRMGAVPSSNLFQGAVNYGVNPPGFNPYPYPPNRPNADGTTPLSTTGNYPDIGRAEVRTLWGEQYRHLVVDLGMDMVWQDMMCPALDYNAFEYGTFPLDLMVNNGATYVPNGVCHNVYGLYVLQGTWEGLAALRPGARNFIIARGGYAGMQRYAALWTGDSASSWDFLQINLPEVLNLGLSGVPISGCDIGGFADGTGCVPGSAVFGSLRMDITHFELLTRWMHLGSFLPWYRNHYNGYTKQFQEPYAYGEQVPTNCRRYVELRYCMLQMYYDAMYEWTVTGMPIARALFLNDPGDLAVYDHLDDEFFVGCRHGVRRSARHLPALDQQLVRVPRSDRAARAGGGGRHDGPRLQRRPRPRADLHPRRRNPAAAVARRAVRWRARRQSARHHLLPWTRSAVPPLPGRRPDDARRRGQRVPADPDYTADGAGNTERADHPGRGSIHAARAVLHRDPARDGEAVDRPRRRGGGSQRRLGCRARRVGRERVLLRCDAPRHDRESDRSGGRRDGGGELTRGKEMTPCTGSIETSRRG